MSTASPELFHGDLLDRELNDTLRMELGWEEVSGGLARILIGYGLWILGIVIGLTIALTPVIELGAKFRPNKLGVGHMWAMYAGIGLISVVSILANGIILVGQWKCLIHSSERGWAKWWMFICMVTLAMGPTLGVASGFVGTSQGPELARGVNALNSVRYTTLGAIMQLTSFGFGIAYVVSFTLFLQAAAHCMASRGHVLMTNLFLAFFVPLACVTAYLAVKLTLDPSQAIRVAKPLGLVGLGWVVSMVFWLVLMGLVRSCVSGTMGMVRNPMEYSTAESQLRNRLS